jgi:hypothetical protein
LSGEAREQKENRICEKAVTGPNACIESLVLFQ